MSDPRTQPTTIGPFRVESVLAEGGMGIVYRCIGTDGVHAAVKVLRGAAIADVSLRRRFMREAAIRIEHPNIVRVLDAGIYGPDDAPFIAMELLDGEDLDQVLERRGPLPAREVVALAADACRAIEAAHAQGVIHRDLKPSNLFLCDDGRLKVVDFGIAFLAGNVTRMTSAGGVLGTPAYMSPEQVRGEMAIDVRTDVWSLGAVLYELLSGRLPFDGDTILAQMLAIQVREPEPLWACAPQTPPGLAAAIERALSKRLDLRWESIASFRAALLAVDLEAKPGRVTAALEPEQRSSWFGDTMAAPLAAAPTPRVAESLIPPGEHRIVAVVLAEGVRDLHALREAVVAHGGALLPLLAHRAIGLFGGETWDGDELARAADAALAARAFVQQIAVASGRATSTGAGISGTVLREAELGCAESLEGVAVDAASARSLDGEFTLRRTVRGGFEIAGRSAAVMRRSALVAPLVGREAERAQARAAMRTVIDDARHAILLVSGPPGIGKSRLRQDVETELDAVKPVFVLRARGEPLRRHAALSLLAAAIKSALGELPAAASIDNRPADLWSAVVKLTLDCIRDPAAAGECAVFIGQLLQLRTIETAALVAARSDPQLMVDRLRLAVIDLFEGALARGPVAIVVEDLQWADAASLDLLDDLFDRLADTPLLLVATTRPELFESHPGVFAGKNVTRIEPRPLGRADVGLLASWIAGRPLDPALVNALAERTSGHPLFVEQIVLELRDTDRLDAPPESLPTTLTVEAAVQSRLDYLPPAEKEACKRAAVFGRPFTADELEGLGVAGATGVLGSLGRRDLVAGRARAGGGREFTFRSSLVADVAYAMIADEPRRELHRRAAAYLRMRGYRDDEEIATHDERAGELAKAAASYANAALGNTLPGDADTVLRCADAALRLGAPAELLFRLHMARATVLRFLERREEQGEALAIAKTLAQTDVDRAKVLAEQGQWLFRTGRRAEALVAAQEAIEASKDADALGAAGAVKVVALIYLGRLSEAAAALTEVMASAAEATLQTRAFLTDVRGHLAAALGDHGGRIEAFSESAALFREAGDVRRAAGAEVNVADAHNRLGSYAEAEIALRQAREACRRVKNRPMEGYALVNLGYALSRQGKNAQALEALAEALSIARERSEKRLTLWARTYIARTHLSAASDAEGARAVVGEAEAIAEEATGIGESAISVTALTIVTNAHLASGDVAAAERVARSLREVLSVRGGAEEDEGEVFATCARALDANGESREAHIVRLKGRARLEEVAQRIASSSYRARFLTAIEAHRELMATEP